MKKSFLLVAMIATAIFFFGCSSSETVTTAISPDVPQLYFPGEDTVISSQKFTLSPFSKEYCGDVVKGKYWNPTGFQYDTVRTQGALVSQDSLKKWFGVPCPTANTSLFAGMSSWLEKLLWFLLALVLIGLTIALLIWAFRSARESSQRSHFVATGAPGANENKINTESKISHSAHTAQFGKEDYDGVIAIIAALKKGDTGGTVDFNGAVTVHIPSGNEVNIYADNGSTIANVDVNVHSGGNAYGDMGTAYQGDDHRQYNRQSGGSKEKSSDKTDETK